MVTLKSTLELEGFRSELLSHRDLDSKIITVCSGTGCHAYNSEMIVAAFEGEVKTQHLDGKVEVKRTGCHGFCEKGPLVVIFPEEICYLQVKAEDVAEIVSRTVVDGEIIDRLLYTDLESGEKIIHESEIPFYKHQTRLILANNTRIDPRSIDDYITTGGYTALAKALREMTPEQVLNEVKKSNLRGRGGGGFPVGRKWESCRNAESDIKYVIVNADEGDPGAYMNRTELEGNPHMVLEGLIIGAYAIGAQQGYVYVRQEYPLAVEHINLAIKKAEEYGFLGNNILGSDFTFKVEVQRGAGAFVSGESSALMTAIEGRVGEPRPKYTHTVIKGVWDRPSTLNNVETWAFVPQIINKGADWFTSIGTEGSKGTKVFSLVGKVNNTGLVEVPMGTTLRDIIFKIGGGIAQGKKFKAVQTGGPSGGCIPEEYLDIPVDFDELTKLGSIMGSGGMIVMDEDTCMVDVARYFIDFLCDESCGKCTPCREGLKQLRYLLNNLTEGKGTREDLVIIEELSWMMSSACLCQLGATAPNPILSTMKYFRDEYLAHVDGRCPAFACKSLISFYIDPDKCTGCQICVRNCPVDAISGEKKMISVIDQEKCTKCGSCFDVCPPRFQAVTRISGEPVPEPLPPEKRAVASKGK